MKKVELLAPAGSLEALQAAVMNGADAVYLGGKHYGARAFANNFDEAEMKQAVEYAHQYGVRVFVTVNTLIYEEEIHSCLDYIGKLQELDVDAVLLQDLGLAMLVRQRYPNLELHASTQMHIHNREGIALMKELGFQRVVLPRETSIEDIREYAKLGMDLEVFVQGALCVSYSGQCLMSSLTLSRSGNRGECAQNCRMQYSLEKTDMYGTQVLKGKHKYLLSPKDLNTLSHIGELIDAGVYSFKIEGRMKRPEYVALMTACYRKAIDAYMAKEPFEVSAALREEMQKIFNRGFTAGHIFHEMGSHLMNPLRPNHMGIEIGKIVSFTKDKVQILLTKQLSQGDGIRILNEKEDCGFTINRLYVNGYLVKQAEAGALVELDKTFYAQKGSRVLKTSDCKQLLDLQDSYKKNKRYVAAYAEFTMQLGAHARLSVMDTDGFYAACESLDKVEKAIKTPLSKERIVQQLQKSKDSIFQLEGIELTVDEQTTLPIKEINRMRREALEQLANQRKLRHPHRLTKSIALPKQKEMSPLAPIIAVVHTKEQYEACQKAGIAMIFMYEELHDKLQQGYVRTPRVMKQAYPDEFVMIQENGGSYAKRPFLCDTSCNIINHHSAAFFFQRGARGVCFSLEASLAQCCEIVKAYEASYQAKGNFIYPVYGREELMLSEYCAINAIEKDSDKKQCGLCRKAEYALVDIKGQRYPLLCDKDCRMHILNAQPRNRIADIKQAKQVGITSFLCVFTKENKTQCVDVLQKLRGEV